MQTILAEGFEGKSISGLEDVPNEVWELEIQSGSWTLKLSSGVIPVDKINVLELQIELWLDPCR